MQNRKLRVGIVGAGGIARGAHLPGWKKLDDVEVVAIADISAEARETVAREYGIPRAVADYRAIAEMKDVDIVDICAPNAVHYPAAMAAFAGGKHVLCEKPMTVSTKEAEEMIRAAQEAKVVLMAAQHQRFRTDSAVVKRLIDDGYFGEIYHVAARALRRRLLPARPTFIQKELSGGGPLLDIGVHILDLTYWFMGCPKVSSVSGIAVTKLAKRTDIRGQWGEWDRDAYNVEDFAAGFVRFANGASLSLACSFLANMEKTEDFSADLFGTEAGMRWPDGKVAIERLGVLQDIELRMRDLPQVQPHAEEIRVFVECVRKGLPVPVKPEETLEVIKMLEGIYTSATTGTEVKFS